MALPHHARGDRADLAGSPRAGWHEIGEGEVRAALGDLDPLWEEQFPAEQARVVQLLVERVDVAPDGIGIRPRTERLANLVQDLRAGRQAKEAA